MKTTNHSSGRHRRSIRLPNYDYAQSGAYFVTICTRNRAPLFGDVIDDKMLLNDAGRIVWECWESIPDHYTHAKTDAFIVMPNHVHGIIILTDTAHVGAGLKPAPTPTGAKRHPLSEIVRALKTFSARRINEHRGVSGTSVWQRNYYENVIRNESALHDIRQYILHNPAKWADDPENPRNMTQPP